MHLEKVPLFYNWFVYNYHFLWPNSPNGLHSLPVFFHHLLLLSLKVWNHLSVIRLLSTITFLTLLATPPPPTPFYLNLFGILVALKPMLRNWKRLDHRFLFENFVVTCVTWHCRHYFLLLTFLLLLLWEEVEGQLKMVAKSPISEVYFEDGFTFVWKESVSTVSCCMFKIPG